MPKRTGEKNQVLIKFEGESLAQFEALRDYYLIENGTDLVRFLVGDAYRKIETELPRFKQLNFDEHGVKIWDSKLKASAQIYFKSEGAFCDLCQEKRCPHIDFALTRPLVRDAFKKKGWKLPEV